MAEQKYVSRKELADALGISANRVSELHGLGILPRRQDDGKYHLELCKSKYEAYSADHVSPVNNDILIAKTRLAAQRAKQQWIKCCDLASTLVRRELVEKYHAFNRQTIEQSAITLVESILAKTADLQTPSEIGRTIFSEVNATLTGIANKSESEFFALYPELAEPIFTEECRTEFLDPDPQESYRAAVLEKIKWLSEYEDMRTGVMLGDYYRRKSLSILPVAR